MPDATASLRAKPPFMQQCQNQVFSNSLWMPNATVQVQEGYTTLQSLTVRI